MPELTEKQTKDLEKKREKATNVQRALDDDIPFEVLDGMESLQHRGIIKRLNLCFKRGGVDGLAFLGSLDSMLREWKALSKVMDATRKMARKEEEKISKLLGTD